MGKSHAHPLLIVTLDFFVLNRHTSCDRGWHWLQLDSHTGLSCVIPRLHNRVSKIYLFKIRVGDHYFWYYWNGWDAHPRTLGKTHRCLEIIFLIKSHPSLLHARYQFGTCACLRWIHREDPDNYDVCMHGRAPSDQCLQSAENVAHIFEGEFYKWKLNQWFIIFRINI